MTSIGRAVDQALVGRGATQNHITGQGSVPKCEPNSACAKDWPFLLIVAEVSQNLARKTRSDLTLREFKGRGLMKNFLHACGA